MKETISTKEIHDFLMASLFEDYNPTKIGNSIDNNEVKIDLALKRAYRDMNRTLRTKKHQDEWNELKKNGRKKKIKDSIQDKDFYSINNKDEYDNWFYRVVNSLICINKIVAEENDVEVKLEYTYGQAQKWINMTMKYLIVLQYEPVIKVIQYLHVPIDEIVADTAIAESKTKYLKNQLIPWSKKIDEKIYKDFQNEIKEKTECPIKWEFNIWNKGKKISTSIQLH